MPLEGLPPEIQVIIMSSVSHLETLSNIVHASPVYHQTYINAQEQILHNITVRTLYENNVSTLDAWTAVNAPQISHSIPHRKDMITEFLDRYGDGLTDGRQRFTVDDSTSVLKLQRKIQLLVQDYCQKLSTRNPNPFTTQEQQLEQEYKPRRPTQFELRRLYRAFHRYEIYSNIFCSQSCTYAIPHKSNAFSETLAANSFLKQFPAHEVEEIACLHNYTRQFYEDSFPTSVGCLDTWTPYSCVYNLASQGPSFLYEVLKLKSQQERRGFCERVKNPYPEVALKFTLDTYERVLDAGDGWDWKGVDEAIRNGEPEWSPTAAWLWACRQGLQNVDFRMRRWGYVFWDEERLKSWGITEDVLRNWPRSPLMRATRHVRC